MSTATFLLEDTFILTNRGVILMGQIGEGAIRIGDTVVLPRDGGERRELITGVELGHGHSPDGSVRGFVGLHLGRLLPADMWVVQHALSAGQLLLVENET